MSWKLTRHARRRIEQRGIEVESILAALETPRRLPQRCKRGTVLHYDKSSRVAVVVSENNATILTAYKISRSQLKKKYSR